MAAGRNIDDWKVLMKFWNGLRYDIHLALEKGYYVRLEDLATDAMIIEVVNNRKVALIDKTCEYDSVTPLGTKELYMATAEAYENGDYVPMPHE